MAPRPIDARAAERCASIVGAKQKGDEPSPSHVSVTDVGPVVFPAKYDARNADRSRRLRRPSTAASSGVLNPAVAVLAQLAYS